MASLEDDRVVGLQEKPILDLPTTIGVLIMNGDILERLNILSNQKDDLDIMTDLIPFLINQGKHVHAYFHDSFWHDVGSMERYEKLNYGVVEKFLGKIIS